MKFVATTLSAALFMFASVGCDESAVAPTDDAGPAAPEMSDPAGTQDNNPEPLGGGGTDPGTTSPQPPAGGDANP